jgi:hypothetical protein
MVGPAQLNLKRYYLPSKRTGIGRKNADSGTVQVADRVTAKEAFASFFPGFSERDLLVMKTIVSTANCRAVARKARSSHRRKARAGARC